MTDELYARLNAPKDAKCRIETNQEKIKELHIMMLPSGIRYDKDYVQTSPEDPMLKFAEKLERLEKEKVELERRYIEAYEDVEALSKKLNNADQEKIIVWRHLLCKNNRDYANKIDRAESSVNRLYGDAIKALEVIIRKDDKKIQ